MTVSMPLGIIRHCAKECEYQRSGEMSVYWMVDAFAWAQAHATHPPHRPTYDDILRLGKKVEPHKNRKGTRKVNVRAGFDLIDVDFKDVPSALKRLVQFGDQLTPEEWFREYEEIHPFVDGNGRTGNILYNWLKGTLEDPEMPPDFWNQGRIVGHVL